MIALLVIDIQNDFLPGGALPVPDGDAVIAVANRLMPDYELVVATQDWHPPDHGSFAANHPGHHVGDRIELNGCAQMLWPTHCVQDTTGADFAAALDTHNFSTCFRKGTDPAVDSYSGFFDNDHHRATGMGDYLHSRGVQTVEIVGLATDYCVKFTALDARKLGFETSLIAAGCRGVELHDGDIAHALDELASAGVRIQAA